MNCAKNCKNRGMTAFEARFSKVKTFIQARASRARTIRKSAFVILRASKATSARSRFDKVNPSYGLIIRTPIGSEISDVPGDEHRAVPRSFLGLVSVPVKFLARECGDGHQTPLTVQTRNDNHHFTTRADTGRRATAIIALASGGIRPTRSKRISWKPAASSRIVRVRMDQNLMWP